MEETASMTYQGIFPQKIMSGTVPITVTGKFTILWCYEFFNGPVSGLCVRAADQAAARSDGEVFWFQSVSEITEDPRIESNPPADKNKGDDDTVYSDFSSDSSDIEADYDQLDREFSRADVLPERIFRFVPVTREIADQLTDVHETYCRTIGLPVKYGDPISFQPIPVVAKRPVSDFIPDEEGNIDCEMRPLGATGSISASYNFSPEAIEMIQQESPLIGKNTSFSNYLPDGPHFAV